ncbi:MAG: hypothetical protein ACKV2Q_06725 [Planctomycetaceae bacterium]
MTELLISLSDLALAAWSLLKALSGLLLPWIPLAVWIGFWLCAVNWIKLREVLISKGGVLGLLLIGAIWVLIWGVVAPPASGTHFLLGLTVTNFVGKLVYVTALFCLMFLCGSVQLSGCCQQWCEVTMPDPHAHGDHGHAGHESHGHAAGPADHGHAAH